MTIRDQIKEAGGIAAFARRSGIPYRTAQSWWRQGHADGRTPPAWLEKNFDELRKCRMAIDDLQTHAVRDVVPGIVGIPEVEWDSIFHAFIAD